LPSLSERPNFVVGNHFLNAIRDASPTLFGIRFVQFVDLLLQVNDFCVTGVLRRWRRFWFRCGDCRTFFNEI
jgi:hypothetical protein